MERLPRGNLWCESYPFSSSIRSRGLQNAQYRFHKGFILLLIRRISALGNSFLRRVLEMVLQVDAESICALTTFVFSSCLSCRFAKYFLTNRWALSHSVTKVSSSVSSETKLDCCCRACCRVPPLHTCRAIWLTGLLMFSATSKTL